MTSDLAVSTTDVIECLRFVRMHLYAAQAQASDCDDKIIMQHVRDAYARTSDICREIEMYGMTFFGHAAHAAQDKSTDIDKLERLLREANEIVRSKPTFGRFIDGTPLSNDIAVWMAAFAQDVLRRAVNTNE